MCQLRRPLRGLLARPEPLTVASTGPHSADTNRDFAFTLIELTRVIELYNMRHGSTRTGRSRATAGPATKDGFEADSAGQIAREFPTFHAADTRECFQT